MKVLFITLLYCTSVLGGNHLQKHLLKRGAALGTGPFLGAQSPFLNLGTSFGNAKVIGHDFHTTITRHIGIPVPQPIAVPVERHVPVPVKVPITVPVDRPFAIPVPQRVPVPVDRPVAVAVDQPFAFAVPQPVPVPVVRQVGIPIPQPFPVRVQTPVPVPVAQPFPVPATATGLSPDAFGLGPNTLTNFDSFLRPGVL